MAPVLFTDSANADLATLRRSFRIPRRLLLIGLAVAQAAGGSGFIACFSGGLAFGGMVERNKNLLLGGAEGAGHLLSLLTWTMFDAATVGTYADRMSGPIVVFALLSLTIVRMLPVSLSLLGLGLRRDAYLFLGWFGPRGLASIVFAVIVMDANVTGSDTLAATAVCTVTLSILAHGLSANPLAAVFAAREKTAADRATRRRPAS